MSAGAVASVAARRRSCAGAAIGLTLALGSARPACAQPEAAVAALVKALEGREVRARIDMPATAAGIDLHVQREPEIDAPLLARRIADYGVAIRLGQMALITKVKVNKKNIEVQLGGGGYGTLADDDGLVIAKLDGPSPRQKALERERSRTTDPQRKREIERELSDLRDELRRQHDEAFRHAEALTAINKREIARKRLDGGSRLNVWYADKRLEQWAPTAEELLYSLSSYLEIIPADDGPPRVAGLPPRPTTDASSRGAGVAVGVRAGMTVAEVYGVMGFPTRRTVSPQGELDGTVETWEAKGQVVEVTFVSGVAVKVTSPGR